MTAPSPAARVFGYAMIAVGALMTFLSGTCTLFFLTTSLMPKGQGGGLAMIGVSLGLGLPFILAGIALVVGGRKLSRNRGPRIPPDGDR